LRPGRRSAEPAQTRGRASLSRSPAGGPSTGHTAPACARGWWPWEARLTGAGSSTDRPVTAPSRPAWMPRILPAAPGRPAAGRPQGAGAAGRELPRARRRWQPDRPHRADRRGWCGCAIEVDARSLRAGAARTRRIRPELTAAQAEAVALAQRRYPSNASCRCLLYGSRVPQRPRCICKPSSGRWSRPAGPGPGAGDRPHAAHGAPLVARFGSRVAVLHSGLRGGERYDAWRRIRNGERDIVVGAPLGVFAPSQAGMWWWTRSTILLQAGGGSALPRSRRAIMRAKLLGAPASWDRPRPRWKASSGRSRTLPAWCGLPSGSRRPLRGSRSWICAAVHGSDRCCRRTVCALGNVSLSPTRRSADPTSGKELTHFPSAARNKHSSEKSAADRCARGGSHDLDPRQPGRPRSGGQPTSR